MSYKILKIIFQEQGEKRSNSLAIASIFNAAIGKLD